MIQSYYSWAFRQPFKFANADHPQQLGNPSPRSLVDHAKLKRVYIFHWGHFKVSLRSMALHNWNFWQLKYSTGALKLGLIKVRGSVVNLTLNETKRAWKSQVSSLESQKQAQGSINERADASCNILFELGFSKFTGNTSVIDPMLEGLYEGVGQYCLIAM